MSRGWGVVVGDSLEEWMLWIEWNLRLEVSLSVCLSVCLSVEDD